MQVYLTTTGTQTNTIINDLGKALFVHPKINIPLIEPLGEFTINDISTSVDLINAVSSGFITLTNIDGTNITSLSNITDKQNDHSNLTGLLTDSHTQYLNNTRGDVRYISKTLASTNIYVGNGSNFATPVVISGDASLSNTGALSLSNVGTAGTYKSITTDAKGRVTAGTNPTTLAGYGITDAQPLDADLTSVAALSTLGILTRSAINTFATRTNTGTTNRLTITNGDGISGNPTYDIASTYVGQSSITTLGTITTGVWNGSPVSVLYGGTGATTVNNALNNLLPLQTGNANRSLITDGTNTSWVLNNLQTSYNNSSTSTKITTNSTLGALTLRRGSTADTDNVLTIQNGTGLSKFNIQGDGVARIRTSIESPAMFIEPPTGITDPQISLRNTRLYIECDRINSIDGIRVFFNDGGNPDFGGYVKFNYNGNSPEITLLDMDEDPSYITFSIARQNLSNPGTFNAPAIVSKFGARGTVAGGLTGFSWLTNGGVSGGALTEIMSCDNNFLAIPTRINANRPATPVNGMVGYNSTLNKVEAYENGAWTQYIDTTTNQTGITGNKIFSGRVQAANETLQYFNATGVTTTLATFAVITGMTFTTTSPLIATYLLRAVLNIRNSTNAATVVEVQVFVNGVADPDTLINYSMSTNVTPVFIPIYKSYPNTAVGTVYDIRWRRVSGTATPTVTTKSLILQEIL